MHQVWMRTAVAGPLNKRQVLGVLDRACKRTDRLGQQVCVIRHLHALRDLRLRQAAGMNHRLLVLDLLPFEALLAAGDVEALAVLPGRIEKAARYLGLTRKTLAYRAQKYDLLRKMGGMVRDDANVSGSLL